MTACKSATKDKKKSDVRQKALCKQLHSWGHSSQHVQVKTDIPQSTSILMYYQKQCKHCTDTFWKFRRQPFCMDTKPSFPMLLWNCRLLSEFFTWDNSETFQQCPQCGHGQVFSTRTIPENTSVICTENLKPSTDLSDFVILMVAWSISPQYTENPQLQMIEWRETNFLTITCITNTFWDARGEQVSWVWQAGSKTEQEPDLTLLAFVFKRDKEGKRDKVDKGLQEGRTELQTAGSVSLPTTFCLDPVKEQKEGKSLGLYCPEKLLKTYHCVATCFSPPFPYHDIYCKKQWWIIWEST